jgi:hypothetical protein
VTAQACIAANRRRPLALFRTYRPGLSTSVFKGTSDSRRYSRKTAHGPTWALKSRHAMRGAIQNGGAAIRWRCPGSRAVKTLKAIRCDTSHSTSFRLQSDTVPHPILCGAILVLSKRRFTRQLTAWIELFLFGAFWFIMSRARELTIFPSSMPTVATSRYSHARRALRNRVLMSVGGGKTSWNLIIPVSLMETIKGMTMPSSHLKRAERAIQSIRDQAELPPERADTLQELIDVVRYIDGRLSALERKGKPHPTEAMALPNRK